MGMGQLHAALEDIQAITEGHRGGMTRRGRKGMTRGVASVTGVVRSGLDRRSGRFLDVDD